MKQGQIWIPVLFVVLLAMVALSVCAGAVAIPPGRVLQALVARGGGELDPTQVAIVWELRLPRVLLAVLVGAGLGSAGAGYQGLFRNPLADPFVIGASSGAALGATVAIIAGFESGAWGMSPVAAAAFAGALLAVTLVYGIASVGRQVPTLSLLLAGVAVSSLIGALVSLLMFFHDEMLVNIVGWLMGSLSGRGWAPLRTTTWLVLTAVLALWICSRALDALTFGEETARSLGLNMTRCRLSVVVAASLATAAAVSASGIVGFIGLIAPHVARLFVGARHAAVIPASGFIGAVLLLAADDLARTVVAPAELPVGVMTALLGSPVFLYLLKTRQRELSGS
jgi:iron complex transport system permease protein